jgi:putative spermidine/putrescine transport system substrate-binding protein
MDRRSFLRLGVGSLGLSSLGLTGCGGIAVTAPRVVGLKNSVPPQLVKRFRQLAANTPAAQLAYSQRSLLPEIFEQLQTWQQVAQGKRPIDKPWFSLPTLGQGPIAEDPLPDLVTLGDYWLEIAIKQGLIEPLKADQWSRWATVDPIWQRLAKRDAAGQLNENGQIWAAPYRWGATAIAYRADLFAQHKIAPPTDWQDLFNPQLKGRISLLDSPREVIGLALKHLGKRYTDAAGQPIDLTQIPELVPTLQALHQQAKMYSSNAYLQPLILGHTWLAVGWTSELLPQLRTEPDITVVVPRSGTTLWADFWVRPKRGNPSSDRPYNPWIDAFWEPEFAAKEALLSLAGSPLGQRMLTASPDDQQRNPLLNLPEELWAKCEPLPQLDAARASQFEALWRKVRGVGPEKK